MKKIFILSFVCAASVTAVSCQEKIEEPVPQPKEPQSWTVASSEVTYKSGETFRVNGTLVDAMGMESTIDGFCTSTDDSVLYADGGWDVVALAPGTAVINSEVRFYNHGISKPSSLFQQTVNVTIVPEDRILTGLNAGAMSRTMKRGDSVILTVEAIYANGERKRIHPMLLEWDVKDDGIQHVTYVKRTSEIRAHQEGGPTELTVSFTENGIKVSTVLSIEVTE